MKKSVKAILIIIAVLIYTTGVMVGSYYLFHIGEKPFNISIRVDQPIKYIRIKNPTTCAGYKECNDSTINIITTADENFIDIVAVDLCKSSVLRLEVIKCTPKIKKYSIGIQPMILAGYNKDFNKIDILAGGEIFFLRNYKLGSIGAGLIYQQGLIIKQYYAGASIIGKLDF
jgi:hypothetical protein